MGDPQAQVREETPRKCDRCPHRYRGTGAFLCLHEDFAKTNSCPVHEPQGEE